MAVSRDGILEIGDQPCMSSISCLSFSLALISSSIRFIPFELESYPKNATLGTASEVQGGDRTE